MLDVGWYLDGRTAVGASVLRYMLECRKRRVWCSWLSSRLLLHTALLVFLYFGPSANVVCRRVTSPHEPQNKIETRTCSLPRVYFCCLWAVWSHVHENQDRLQKTSKTVFGHLVYCFGPNFWAVLLPLKLQMRNTRVPPLAKRRGGNSQRLNLGVPITILIRVGLLGTA